MPSAGVERLDPNVRVIVKRENAPAADEVRVSYINLNAKAPVYELRGAAEIETTESLLKADEIDYNEETGATEARGNVYLKNMDTGEELWCDRAEYNVNEQTGKFYNVKGLSPVKLDARPGVLTSPNPFVFQGKWAERIKDRYILHSGFITSCKLPRPIWRLTGPRFDIIPGNRAIAERAMFKIKGVPLFYTPYFYKSLAKQPRRSGFLTPKFGNTTRRGFMYGLGYYWAINRSYDLLYQANYFTQRGFAHNVDFRAKPREGTDLNVFLWGINDRGRRLPDGSRFKEGGFYLELTGRTEIGKGWYARATVKYLTSLQFRQAFTETFNEAIFSEVNSIGFIAKHWKLSSFHAVFSRQENFQSTAPDDKITIRRLPQFEFVTRETRIGKKLPVWVSLDSTGGFVRRNQPLFQTRQYVERLDAAPRVTTAFHLGDFHIIPSAGVRGTYWGSTRPEGQGLVVGTNATRFARDAQVDVVFPALAKIMDSPARWMGTKIKHVIEPRASYRWVSGVADFQKIIRFDDIELVNNTNEAEVSIANRLYTKERDGRTREWASWTVWHRRYFDPQFGGNIVPGERNVIQSQTDLTAFAFFDRFRRYSPIVNAFRAMPRPGFGIEWRADYDPVRGGMTNSSVTADGRVDNLILSVGHTQVKSVPSLSPPGNQFRGLIGLGRENRRGWNTAFFAVYDYRVGQLQFTQSQVTYNSDCCGLSFQYRRFSFGTRNENQYRVAFVVANIGSFGNLRRQERFF